MAMTMHNPDMSALSGFEHSFYHGLEPSFGMGYIPRGFYSGRIMNRPHNMSRHLDTGNCHPWALAREAANELVMDQKNLHFGKDGFQAQFDVHHFKPNEITMKTVDNTVVLEGKHEERDDGHGSVTRHFIRKYVLPKEYDPHSIHSNLSSDGVLTVKAPPPKQIKHGIERHVPIHRSPAQLSLKDNHPTEEKKVNRDHSPHKVNFQI